MIRRKSLIYGAGDRIRTHDPRITNAPLYLLSYTGDDLLLVRKPIIVLIASRLFKILDCYGSSFKIAAAAGIFHEIFSGMVHASTCSSSIRTGPGIPVFP